MPLGKALKKAMGQCISEITKPFTHSARHKIEDDYQNALIECHRQEYHALNHLYLQRQEERNKIALQKKNLEESLKNNADQLRAEKTKLSQYFLEKENAFKELFENIRNNFESLRAGLQACIHGKNEIVKSVLQKGIDLKRQFLSFGPLHFAADNNQTTIIQLLCQQGADVHRRNSNYGCTALDIAEERGQEEACNALKTIIKETEIFWKAVDAEDYTEMKSALERGAAINASFPGGYNILQKTLVDERSYKLIRWLVESGADCYHQSIQLPKKMNEVLQPSLSVETTETREVISSDVPNNAITLASYHPDWRIKDYLIEKLGIQLKNLESACVEKDRNFYYKISSHLTCALKACSLINSDGHSAFIVNKGKKEFFSVSVINKTLSFVVYDVVHKQWFQEFFGTGQRVPYQDLTPIQLLKVKVDKTQEKLYLLTLQSNRNVLLWNYEPEARKWHVCSSALTLEESSHVEMQICDTNEGESLFLIVRREGRTSDFQSYVLQIFRYYPDRNVWTEYQNNFSLIASQPQMLAFQNENEKTVLFILIERYVTAESGQKKYELWAFDPESCLWTVQPETPWSNISPLLRQIQMRLVKVAGETQLYFSCRSATGMQLWSYHVKSKLWQWHPGEPSWPLLNVWRPISEKDLVKMQIIPGHEKNSDIILFLRQSKRGIECQSYHPLSKRWCSLDIPGCTTEPLQLREDHQKIQMHLELIQNQYQMIIFTATGYLEQEPQVQSWTHAVNVMNLEKLLTEKSSCKEIMNLSFSEAELNEMRSFIHNIFKASQTLLTAARAGDWASVFASLEQGADVYATESEGYNALQLALRHPIDLTTLKRLLQAGISLNHRANLQNKTTLDLARDSNLVEIHDYIANLLERPVISLTPDIRHQFNQLYQQKFEEAKAFLNKRGNNIHQCQAILCYYRLKTRTNPYAIYIWPGMLMLGEILTLFPSVLKKNDLQLSKVQDFFIKTYAFHQALCSVGIEHYESLRLDPLFKDAEWTYIIDAILLKEAAESYAKDHGISETNEEVQKIIFNQHQKTVFQGIRFTLTEFSKIMGNDAFEGGWIQEASEWMTQKLLQSPFQLKESYKEYLQQHLNLSASLAKQANQAGLLLLPPKLTVENEIKSINEQEIILEEKLKLAEQSFMKEKEELEQWLIKREEECIKCVKEINTLLKLNHTMGEEIELQFNHAIEDLNAQFAHFRNVLSENKEEALRQVQKKAFKSLVVTAGACCIAHMLAPLLTSALGSVTAGLSAKTMTLLETLLKGGIMEGIKGGFSGQNILEATLKGAGLSAIGNILGKFTNKFIDPSLSECHHAIHIALPLGMEAVIRTKLEGGKMGENIISAVGSGLLLDKTPWASPVSKGFMFDLRNNLFKSFIGGGVYSLVAKQHFGSSVASAGIIGAINTGAEHFGKKMASPFLPKSVALPKLPQDITKTSTPSKKSKLTTSDACKLESKKSKLTTSDLRKTDTSIPRNAHRGDSKSLIDQFLSESRIQLAQNTPHFPQAKPSNSSLIGFFINSASAGTPEPTQHIPATLMFSKSNLGPTDARVKQRQSVFRKQNTPLSETMRAPKGRAGERFSSMYHIQKTQEVINFRTVGMLSAFSQYPDFQSGVLPRRRVYSHLPRSSFNLPSCLPKTHDNPYLRSAIQIGRGIEIARDATVDALLHPIDTVMSLPLFIWDMSGAASQAVFGRCTKSSIIRNQERWEQITTAFDNFKKADFSTQLGMGSQMASGLIFGAAVGGMGCSVLPMKSRVSHKSSTFIVDERMGSKLISDDRMPLTKKGIIDYLSHIYVKSREELIKDFEMIGLQCKGRKDGRFLEFTDRNLRTRVKIHPQDKVTTYHHLHIYDKFGNSLNKKLERVSYKSKEAHIEIRDYCLVTSTIPTAFRAATRPR